MEMDLALLSWFVSFKLEEFVVISCFCQINVLDTKKYVVRFGNYC